MPGRTAAFATTKIHRRIRSRLGNSRRISVVDLLCSGHGDVHTTATLVAICDPDPSKISRYLVRREGLPWR